ALAVLLSFVLAPLVNRFERIGLGRIVSVLIASTLALLLVATLTWAVFGQALDLTRQLPQYKDNIREKIQALQHKSTGPLGEATKNIKDISKEVLSTATQPESRPAEAALPVSKISVPASRPIPVEIAEKPPSAMQAIAATIRPLLNPLLRTGIVIVFTI